MFALLRVLVVVICANKIKYDGKQSGDPTLFPLSDFVVDIYSFAAKCNLD